MYNPDTKTPSGGAMGLRKMVIVLIAGLAFVQVAYAQEHWVTTWVAAPRKPGAGGPPPAAQAAPGQRGAGPAVAPAPTAFEDQTVRMIIHSSLGGRRARVTLSNAYGNMPLKIGTAHVALRSK